MIRIRIEPPKQNVQEIRRYQAGLTKVSHAPNTAALHAVEGVKMEKDPSVQQLICGTILTTEQKELKIIITSRKMFLIYDHLT